MARKVITTLLPRGLGEKGSAFGLLPIGNRLAVWKSIEVLCLSPGEVSGTSLAPVIRLFRPRIE